MAFEGYLAIISRFPKLIVYLDFIQVISTKIVFHESLIWMRIEFIYMELGEKLGCELIIWD